MQTKVRLDVNEENKEKGELKIRILIYFFYVDRVGKGCSYARAKGSC